MTCMLALEWWQLLVYVDFVEQALRRRARCFVVITMVIFLFRGKWRRTGGWRAGGAGGGGSESAEAIMLTRVRACKWWRLLKAISWIPRGFDKKYGGLMFLAVVFDRGFKRRGREGEVVSSVFAVLLRVCLVSHWRFGGGSDGGGEGSSWQQHKR